MCCIENAVIYFMFPVDSNIDAMQYIVFLLLSFGIISCSSYSHLEDATQECSRCICSCFGCDVRVSSYIDILKCACENCKISFTK
jgi:hypothetical protein